MKLSKEFKAKYEALGASIRKAEEILKKQGEQ